MRIKLYVSDFHACGHVRGEIVARELNRHFPNHHVDLKNDIVMSDYFGTEMMIFQRQEHQAVFDKMMLAKEHGIKVVYEIDDDILLTPKEFTGPFKKYSSPDMQASIMKFMQEADALIVSTPVLAESLSARLPGKPIHVVRNFLNVDMWEEAYIQKEAEGENGHVTIGWLASGSHTIDAPLIAEPLKILMEEVDNLKLHFIGWITPEELPWAKAFGDRVVFHPWVNISVLPQAMKDFDIGLAPLVDNPFNRAKSSIKALQTWALAAPCVASPLDPYIDVIEDGVTGFMPDDNSPEAWLESLSKLVLDPALRKQMGLAGRKELYEKHDIRQNAVHWARTFDAIMAA